MFGAGFDVVEGGADDLADFAGLGLAHAARGDRGRADADAAGHHRLLRVERNRVLVHRDVNLVEVGLDGFSGEILRAEVDEQEMRVGAAGDEPHAGALQFLAHRASVDQDLLLVRFERRLERFAEGDGLGGDRVHERAALDAGEDALIERLRVLGFREDQTAARAAQRLVRRRRDVVGERHRRGMQSRRDEAGDVRHVDHEERADLLGDLGERRVIHRARIGARTGDQEFRLVLAREREDFVVIDQLGVFAHAVGDRIVELAAETDLRAVRQVAAVSEGHAQHRVAGLERRHEDGHVGLGARVRLNVGMIGAENLLGAIDRQALGEVDVLAAAVVAASRIAFGVLIGHHRGRRFAHRPAGVVLGGDQFEILALAALLEMDRGGDLRIDGIEQGSIQDLHGA